MNSILWQEYFVSLQPSFWRVFVFIGLIAMSWCVTGYWRLAGKLQPADARKINHVLTLAGLAIWFGWLPEPMARGSALLTAVIILVMVAATCWFHPWPPFNWAFAANTRPSDRPHEALFFWSSWLLSMIALWLADLLFLDVPITRTAALLVGLGDGLAEPIGLRWGYHRYRVYGWGTKRPTFRSVEGSLCVMTISFLVVLFCYWPSEESALMPVVGGALIVAAVLTLVEALSPHGWDNFTIPVSAALVLHATFA
jgi:dolichol kinase